MPSAISNAINLGTSKHTYGELSIPELHFDSLQLKQDLATDSVPEDKSGEIYCCTLITWIKRN
jgi:hypothetical protein